MEEKEINSKKFIMVGMNEMKITTFDKTIIGTEGLSSCISFILHNKENKKTIVSHISTDKLLNEQSIIDIILKLNKLIKENGLKNESFDLHLINGAYKSEQKIYSAYSRDKYI